MTTLLHVTTETTESVSETRIKDSVSWYGWRPETANDDEAPIQFSKGKSKTELPETTGGGEAVQSTSLAVLSSRRLGFL